MKQKIILKESQLNRLIEESVKNVLREENKLTIRNVTEERKCRKEAFRLLHEKAKTANEDVMNRFYGLKANQNKPVRIDEITLDRVLKKHGNNGLINISANRSDGTPQEINDENTKSLIRDLKLSGYSYLPTYGGYRGTDGVEDDYEPSFVVFNYDTKGNARNFEDLKQFALAMCSKYNQDSVLVKAPKQAPIWLDRDGNKANARESEKYWKNDPKQEFFTSFKSKDAVNSEIIAKLMGQYKSYCNHNGIPKTKEGFEKFYNEHLNDIDSIGKRYTYDIGFDECYVNPMPCQLSERMRRKGEVMIWE